MFDRFLRVVRGWTLLSALCLVAASASAQVAPGFNGVPNVDISGAISTFTATGASTVSSTPRQSTYQRGAKCTINITAVGGSPSVTMAIQDFDPTTNTYQTVGITGALTATGATTLIVYPGIQTASLPAGSVGSGLPISRTWRVQTVIGGTATPTITGSVGCGLLK